MDAQEEVAQQYKYMTKLEAMLEALEQQGAARHLRKDLQLLRAWKPAERQEQRIRALKARLAIASRCHRALQVRTGRGSKMLML